MRNDPTLSIILTVVEGADQLHEMGRTVLWKGAQWIRFTDIGNR